MGSRPHTYFTMTLPLFSAPRVGALDLRYLKGDVTLPQSDGPTILPHICNDEGGWGKGFVLSLSNRWNAPEREYRALSARHGLDTIPLGTAQIVQVEPIVWVVNMIAQRGYDRRGQRPSPTPRIRYPALRTALTEVASLAKLKNASIHAPRFGAGLARGNWDEIECIIRDTCAGLTVCIYDFEQPRFARRSDKRY